METLQTLTTLVTIVSIVFGILNLILFFKIWGMTDNVKEILNVIKHDKNIHEDVAPLPNGNEDTHEVPVAPAKQIQQGEDNDEVKPVSMVPTIAILSIIVGLILIFIIATL